MHMGGEVPMCWRWSSHYNTIQRNQSGCLPSGRKEGKSTLTRRSEPNWPHPQCNWQYIQTRVQQLGHTQTLGFNSRVLLQPSACLSPLASQPAWPLTYGLATVSLPRPACQPTSLPAWPATATVSLPSKKCMRSKHLFKNELHTM